MAFAGTPTSKTSVNGTDLGQTFISTSSKETFSASHTAASPSFSFVLAWSLFVSRVRVCLFLLSC